MGTIDDDLAGLEQRDRDVIAHVYAVAGDGIETEQGVSYGMPALRYRGKALIAVRRTKSHIALYPFSGSIPAEVAKRFDGIEYDKGTIRFQPEHPLPDDVVRAVVAARIAEIEHPSGRRG